ncbi:hypothetical protein QJQ45_010964 [Haematococcus lacustris]|nr:hypothetical protein QJQ45_010964 [Haematococcus lacustris]
MDGGVVLFRQARPELLQACYNCATHGHNARAFTSHPGTSASHPIAANSAASATHATGNLLLITLYGLDLWSLLTSWGSRIQALLEAQQSPSLSLQGLSAPGMCASQLLALNTTALLNTSLTAGELMPGLGYFAMDVAQLLREYVNDSSIAVQVPDFCAGNRTVASFIDNRTLVNGPWPTLRVTVNLLTTERLSPSTAPLRQLLSSW